MQQMRPRGNAVRGVHVTAREDAMAASYHADTADAEYKRLFDVTQELVNVLDAIEATARTGVAEGYNLSYDEALGYCEKQARAALEAWAPYRPVWEVTG